MIVHKYQTKTKNKKLKTKTKTRTKTNQAEQFAFEEDNKIVDFVNISSQEQLNLNMLLGILYYYFSYYNYYYIDFYIKK